MFSLDCSACPAPPHGCEGCLVSVLVGEEAQLDGLSEASCGYVLPEGIREAVEVLRAVGLVSEVQIVDVSRAA